MDNQQGVTCNRFKFPLEPKTQTPQARSHLRSVGPRPSHASFTPRSSCMHLHGNSSSLATNVTIPCQNYTYSSWHHFHYSQVNWWSFLHMPKELNRLSDHVLSYWFPTGKSSHAGAGRKTKYSSEGGMGGVRPDYLKMWSSPWRPKRMINCDLEGRPPNIYIPQPQPPL